MDRAGREARSAPELAEWAAVPDDLAMMVASRARAYGYALNDIRSARREAGLAAARAVIAAEARHMGYSYPQIGRALGRDHSTVIAAVRVAARMIG